MVLEIRTVVDCVGIGVGGGESGQGLATRGTKGLPGIMAMFHISNEVVFSWAYTFVKIHRCVFL